MPESRPRKKTEYTAPAPGRRLSRTSGGRWIAPVMCALWIVGLAWIVVFYLAPDLKYMSDLGNWNLIIGMGLICVGFALATRWE